MGFTTGQVLTAAQLNDLDNTSVTTTTTNTAALNVTGLVTLESTAPRILFVDTGETAGDEFDITAHETGPSWSVRATTDGWATTEIKRIEIDSWEGPTYLRVNDGAGNGLNSLILENNTGLVKTNYAFVASAGTGSASAPTFSFEDDTDSGLFLDAAADVRMAIAGSSITTWRATYFGPVTSGGPDNGASAARWKTYYGTNADNISSDERLKTRTGDTLGLAFVNDLAPFAGHWNNSNLGTDTHQWLSAQNVAATLEAHGVDPGGSALWHEDAATGEQSLAYTELVPVLVAAVQQLTARVAELEAAT